MDKLSLSNIGVILCACNGRMAERLPLDEICQSLHELAPSMRVIVSDGLCQTDTLHHLMEKEGLHPLVIGACSQLRPKLYFWEEATKVTPVPYSARVVDLLEETAASYDNTELAERVRLLLWAQVKRVSVLKEISQHNLRLRISPPRDTVTRREFLAAMLPQYNVIPYVESLKCAGGDKCRLCYDSCPLQAVLIEGNRVTIDESICSGCGACIAVCPPEAISYPTFSLEELDNEMEGLLTEGTLLEPRIIVLTCQTCLSGYESTGQNRLRFPPNMLPLEIPCLAMASPWLMLRAFDMGAQGLALISGNGKCRSGLDAIAWQHNVSFVQEILDCWNIEAERVSLFEVTESNSSDIEHELGQFARRVASLAPTPLKAANYTTSSLAEGLRLPALIKGMRSKLTHPSEGTIHAGAVPFGKIKLDSEQCTGCELCALNCPTDALSILSPDDDIGYQLLFKQDSCVACGTCVNICPEDCLELEHILEMDMIGNPASVLFHDSIAKCCQCGKPVAPKSMIDGLKAKLREAGNSLDKHFELCPVCRSELHYREVTGTGKNTQVNQVNTGTAMIDRTDLVRINNGHLY